MEVAGRSLPKNHSDGVRNYLDCAFVNYAHYLEEQAGKPPFDSVKGVFVERPTLYPDSDLGIKNHIQIAVRNQACIKGVFRVPTQHLDLPASTLPHDSSILLILILVDSAPTFEPGQNMAPNRIEPPLKLFGVFWSRSSIDGNDLV